MKKEIRVTKEQFERLIENVHTKKYGKQLKETTLGFMDEDFNSAGNNPGVSAAAGVENVVDLITKAYYAVKNSKIRADLKQILADIGSAAGAAVTTGTREGKENRKPVLNQQRPVRRK